MLWPFEPNLADPIVEEYGYLADVREAQDGTEQRIQLRAIASGSEGFTSLLSERESQRANALLFGTQTRQFDLPLWQYRRAVVFPIYTGQQEVWFDAATVPLVAGSSIVVWRDAFTYVEKEVLQVFPDHVLVDSVFAEDWPAFGSWAMPTVSAVLLDDDTISWLGLAVGETRFTFRVPSFAPEAVPGGGSLEEHVQGAVDHTVETEVGVENIGAGSDGAEHVQGAVEKTVETEIGVENI